MNRKIDHIVYCVENLEDAIRDLEIRLGVKASIGGQHTTQGTKNALINLGNKCYLEMLAIDETISNISTPRWMGIDLLQSPKVTRWSLNSSAINIDSKALLDYDANMGKVVGGTRKMPNGNTLSWQIAMPLPLPEVEVVPFITDWSKSNAHPTDNLIDQCELLEIQLMHPNPLKIKKLFENMNVDIDIIVSEEASIRVTINSPNGIVQL